jgi:hypothetical protein
MIVKNQEKMPDICPIPGSCALSGSPAVGWQALAVPFAVLMEISLLCHRKDLGGLSMIRLLYGKGRSSMSSL